MSDDLVTRLRRSTPDECVCDTGPANPDEWHEPYCTYRLCHEAADEISKLRSEKAAAPELLEALKPLAAWADDPRNKPTLQEAERAKAVFARALGGDHA